MDTDHNGLQMTDMDIILDLPMAPNDANAKTIRGYLKALLRTLIEEQEGFSGKRPFGDSGWTSDLEIPLVKAGLISGKLDENGWLEESDSHAATALILKAIESL